MFSLIDERIPSGGSDALSKSPHLLQTPDWGEFKSRFGWQSHTVTTAACYAQVLIRKVALGFSIAYLAKGPVGHDWQTLWPELDTLCRRQKAVFLQVEPDYFEPTPSDVDPSWFSNFSQEPHTIQPRRTIVIDLRPDEEALLAAMKQKTRYNIRLAEKKAVSVRQSQDLEAFYELTQTTGTRDGFSVHSFAYYKTVFSLFSPKDQCFLLEAIHEGKVLAALMLFVLGERAWYFYGASDDESRNLMPTYLLQWEAMRLAKTKGALSYDLWGVPDEDEEVLERDFASRADGLWGVYRFKRGFGGKLERTAPAYIKVYNPLLYKLYQWMRNRGKAGNNAAG
ncbi:MAG: peptidoglycan bridge formation glycyltransferase FemA/FemB family protein [Anaerolineaceae bacterium]